jgi:hypothetical protein
MEHQRAITPASSERASEGIPGATREKRSEPSERNEQTEWNEQSDGVSVSRQRGTKTTDMATNIPATMARIENVMLA